MTGTLIVNISYSTSNIRLAGCADKTILGEVPLLKTLPNFLNILVMSFLAPLKRLPFRSNVSKIGRELNCEGDGKNNKDYKNPTKADKLITKTLFLLQPSLHILLPLSYPPAVILDVMSIQALILLLSAVDDGMDSDDSEDDADKDESSESKAKEENSRSIRDNLERIVGKDDSAFSGLDLATLIRNKYGRSYDVQLIKKEFMGKNLLAMNVMWKYVEQKSFPLTEEEYLLRLDDVANTLKCWGAVSHIRDSLIKSKERPRIGKAVSIFIDMDESGGRANEWIYR
ncbi:hypothetical protein POM88_018444 [Heracleum sosnowskyi]|uniref:Uncharacterized protein n=1 Tax=Heracleum sosnowskyi TaxID=360622 RepID=A0AAD8ISX5_9APIA|nr:hypothetical protein POM88_018444 [Heracleum sosnowskyi]